VVEPLEIGPELVIPAAELSVRFSRASGPGGQNVNKVASRAALRFNLAQSSVLPPAVKERLRLLAGSRLTLRGQILLTSDRYRDQGRNLADCRRRLASLIRRAWTPPTPRRPTQPGKAAVARRLTVKRQLGTRKRERQRPADEED
jgi:ribosome-associated protein